MLPPLPLTEGALFIDNSGWIENIGTCLRKLEYSQLRKRISSSDRPALNFGQAIHTALEYRYTKYRNAPVDDAYYVDVAEMFREFFDENPAPEGEFRTLNWAMTVLRRYNERWNIEEFNLLQYETPVLCPHCDTDYMVVCQWCSGSGQRPLMVEMPFVLPLYEHHFEPAEWYSLLSRYGTTFPKTIPVYYTGKIDLAVSLAGQIFLPDHKTSSSLGQQFFDRLRMASAPRGYCWAFEELTGQKVAGYIINAIRTKEPPLYIQDPTKAPPKGRSHAPASWWNDSFMRETYLLKAGELIEWKENMINLVEEFFWNYARGVMPMKTSACNMYGRCQYFDVCSLDRNDRELMLQSGLFEDNTWSPLNRVTTKPKLAIPA